MRPVTRAIIERLRKGLISRNRHFSLFRRPEASEALRVHRFLCSVERDLLGGDSPSRVRVQVDSSRWREQVTLRMEFPSIGAARTCTLTLAEYAILVSNPQIGALLGEGGAAG